MGGHSVHLQEESGLAQDRRLVTIHMLPDDVLVEIFESSESTVDPVWYGTTWHKLVHVCRRWRYLVFASPRRLNLRLTYRGRRPMSEVLDVWPVLPVSVISDIGQLDQRWDNVVAALESEHSNRISEIDIEDMSDSLWERIVAVMQKPFSELIHLNVWADDEASVLPDSFLGGSAPRLRSLELTNIPFPSIPKLLLSANRLVKLDLGDIPDSGYFSPNEIATALAVMTRLEFLRLDFHSSRFHHVPASRPLLLPTRLVFPSLTELVFKGIYEYLEDLLARIDAPLLDDLHIEFFMDPDFDVPQLRRLIGHAEEFKKFDHATLSICDDSIHLALYPNIVADLRQLGLQLNFREPGYLLSSLAQACSLSVSLISAASVEELQIGGSHGLSPLQWKDDMENAQWLELLDPFTALKNLYLTDLDGIAQRFCGALQELSRERATEVLPALRKLFVRGSSLEPVQEAMRAFVAARQLSGHPLVVDRWKV